MKAEALRGVTLNAQAIDRAVLAQTIFAGDDHHRPLFHKGRILSAGDWPVVPPVDVFGGGTATAFAPAATMINEPFIHVWMEQKYEMFPKTVGLNEYVPFG